MEEDKQNRIKKELSALKDMVTDFVPNLADTLLNPSVWQSQETMSTALGGIASSFVGSRLKNFFQELWDEKDNIDETILNSDQSNQTFIKLIKFVAQENPEDETWEAAKKIFKQTLRSETTEQQKASLYDMLSIVTTLSGSEIKILAGAYKISLNLEPENVNQRSADWWADRIVEEVGFNAREQVLRYEENLAKQRLIAPRESLRGDELDTWHPGGGRNGCRLSSLGHKLAELLAK